MGRRLAIVLFAAATLTSAAFAAPGARERRAINRADQAWAKRVNLTLRDLPGGFRQGAQSPAGSGGLTCTGFAPDLSRFTITGESSSPAFARADGVVLFSAAEVFRSTSDERGDWNATARREALACLREMLQRSIGTVGKVGVASFRAAPRLGERAVSFRSTVVVAANGRKVTMWLDILAVARGRADATLGVLSVGRGPSAALESALLAKLAARLGS